MNLFFEKQNLSIQDVQSLIEQQVEETLFLEFKGKGSLDKNDEKKKIEMSKDVSAFANSAGGTLIYGIQEKNHKAASLDFVDGNVYTKEWLEQVLTSRIQRRIDGLQIIPIRSDNDLGKTVYIINVPESNNVPHMAADKRFYKRNNVTVLNMEEYEVRQLYSRITKTQLILDDIVIQQGGTLRGGGKLNHVDYKISFQVRNVGKAIENQYKVEVTIPADPLNKAYEYNRDLMQYRIRQTPDSYVYSFPNRSPLFQDELTTIGSLTIRVDSSALYYLNQGRLNLRLYFSNGTQSLSINLLEKLFYEGKLLSLDVF